MKRVAARKPKKAERFSAKTQTVEPKWFFGLLHSMVQQHVPFTLHYSINGEVVVFMSAEAYGKAKTVFPDVFDASASSTGKSQYFRLLRETASDGVSAASATLPLSEA